MPTGRATIEDLIPWERVDDSAYSGWSARPFHDATELAGLLRRIAAELEAGTVEPLGASAHIVHYYLGTDTDGTPNVNLDTGDRSVALGFRYKRVAPAPQVKVQHERPGHGRSLRPIPGA